MKYLRTLLILSIVLFFACGGDGNLYISGKNGTDAVYWMNGVQTDLNKEDKDASAYGIYLDGENIYVSGTCLSDVGDSTPCCWNNGTRTFLESGHPDGVATGIGVSGGDIYIAGNMSVWVLNDSSFIAVKKAVVWKNGTSTILNGDSNINVGLASSLFIASDGGVYIPGEYDGNASYWKDGVETNLGPGSLNSLVVGGGIVYTAGVYNKDAVYYKGSEKTILSKPDTASSAVATSISIEGIDVYVSGNYYIVDKPYACYWKNGVRVDLDDGIAIHTSSEANAISVKNSNVYVAGDYYNTANSKNYACYWKNGVKTDLTFGENTYATARSIIIK